MQRRERRNRAWAVVAFASTLLLELAAAADPPRLQQVPLQELRRDDTAAPTRTEGDLRETPDLKLRVERIWREAGTTYAAVSVDNTSKTTYSEIDLRCTAFDVGEREIGEQRRTLTEREYGTLAPGFKTTLKLPFATSQSEVRSCSCTARGF